MAIKKTKEKIVKKYVVVHHNGRYIRKAPENDAAAIAKVTKGEKFVFLGEVKNGWLKVRVNRKEGWIHSTTGSIREG